MKLRRLLLVYLSALTFLFASVLVSVVVTELEAEKIAEDASRINLAGRQRMLSQRIIYLSQSLSIMEDGDTVALRDALLAAINELEAAIFLFEGSHKVLSDTVTPGSPAESLYFSTGSSGQTLDRRVANYVQLARQILDDPTSETALAGLIAIEQSGLLGDLDAVVSSLETESLNRIALLRNIERASLALALIIILVEVFCVFLPGHRMIQNTLGRLQKQKDELQRAYVASEALRKEQSEFTYAVSHDLKSPATSIELVLSEFLLQEGDKLERDSRDLLDHAMKMVHRIGVQVEDILDYAFATSEKSEFETVNIMACVQAVLADMQTEIAERHARIDVSVDAELYGSRRQILMLLHNLIENAITYHPPGAEVRVSVTAENLPDNGGVQIVVADNGLGIDQGDHAKVFKLFERLHLREDYAGTGLGLATCTRVADNHRGTITLDSELGKGARFTVFLQSPLGARMDVRIEEAA